MNFRISEATAQQTELCSRPGIHCSFQFLTGGGWEGWINEPKQGNQEDEQTSPKTQLCLLVLICFWMLLLIAFCYQIQRELCHLPASIHASPSLPTYPCALPWLRTKQSRKIEVHHGHGAGAGRSVNSAKFKAVAWGGWRDVHVMKDLPDLDERSQGKPWKRLFLRCLPTGLLKSAEGSLKHTILHPFP